MLLTSKFNEISPCQGEVQNYDQFKSNKETSNYDQCHLMTRFPLPYVRDNHDLEVEKEYW